MVVRPDQRGRHDHTARAPQDVTVVRREDRLIAGAQQSRRVVLGPDDPHLLLRHLGRGGRVRRVAVAIYAPAAHVCDRATGLRDRDVREIASVVIRVVHQPARLLADAQKIYVAALGLARDVRDRKPVARRRGRLDNRRRDDRGHREALRRQLRRRMPGTRRERRHRARELAREQAVGAASKRNGQCIL
jgi:hypothetical protein